jgi:hypothetical protein cdiviTM7_02544
MLPGKRLDVLMKVMNELRQVKKDAYKELVEAGNKLVTARDSLNQAWYLEQGEYEKYLDDKESFKRMRSLCGCNVKFIEGVLDNLLEMIERLQEKLQKSESRHLSSTLRIQIREYEEEYSCYDQDICHYNNMIIAAQAELDKVLHTLRDYRGKRKELKPIFDSAKEKRDDAQVEHKSAVLDYSNSARKFATYRNYLAEKIGIPSRYRRSGVFVEIRSDYSVMFYFGGKGGPKGEGCGYYVMNKKGKVIYRQRPVKLTMQG